jgi:hypothetical protein
MEIDLNIFHNFCIGHFDQRSTIFKWKLDFYLGLEFDENLNWILIEFDSNPRLRHD